MFQGIIGSGVVAAGGGSSPATLTVSGATNPTSANGVYTEAGVNNGEPYYESAAGWFIYNVAAGPNDFWAVSQTLNVITAPGGGWLQIPVNEPTPTTGSYVPYGGAAGSLSVS